MTEGPLVTICLITYNYAKNLTKVVESLVHQSYPNTQIIISDDQSTDNTTQIVFQIQKKYPSILYRENTRKLNANEFYDVSVKNNAPIAKKTFDAAFNHCNSLITSGVIMGKFVIFCHQDDLYQKEIIQKQVEFLLANPKIPSVFTRGNVIGADDAIIKPYPFPRELEGKSIFTFKEIFSALLNHGNFFIAPSFMARKELFDSVGLFDDQGPFGGSDDLEMWLRILEKYPIGILQENLIHWRTDGRGKKYNNLRTEKADFFKLMDYYLEEKKYATEASARQLRQYAYQKDFDNTLCAMNFLIKGQVTEAKKIINHSFSIDNFRALVENMKVLRLKVFALKIILFIGINLGLGNPLGKMLRKTI